MKNKIFFAVPHYGGITAGAIPAITHPSNTEEVHYYSRGSSLLAHNFNNLLCLALNEGSYTHFVMMHSDISPPQAWVDVLLAELAASNADIISAVVPIKDMQGLTSTAILREEGIRRITMKELDLLPTTFTNELFAPYPLLVNTGMLLFPMKPWVTEFPGFTIEDKITHHPDGKYVAHVMPEDWGFSLWANKAGLRIAATKAVKISHHGDADYDNDARWGIETEGALSGLDLTK